MNLTDQQITDIAHEYAENCIDKCGFSKGTYEELVDEKAEDAAYVLRWLSKRFCLVEKSVVVDEYKYAVTDVAESKHYNIRISEAELAKKELLESLFPEIAKEAGS